MMMDMDNWRMEMFKESVGEVGNYGLLASL